MSSNIFAVFNPPPTRNLEDDESKDCLPCQIMSTVFSVGFGSYLLSGKAFEYSMKDKMKGITVEEFNRMNPKWWRVSVKNLGGAFIILGLVRGTEGWLWTTKKLETVFSSSN
ncbi:Dmo2p Ecym_4648 [Eremothecium cymbalariae DBVPG|uniref:DUF4536 domain-containing protein n=1 Tax=Eremothecium cymbalariae (strain CBS 270.75 / DBVPG 7215 / KCTC 17166 / NRRL Y-17582) TaxID=931890 RepID=G8JSE9_ERECY|nr:hypothetical protein Ecym_4648 [Eremothecium cymbalariae DBVPG\